MAKFGIVAAAISSLASVVDGAITLLEDLYTQLQEAIGTGDMDEVQAIVDSINEQKQELALAIAANTPAGGEVTPVPGDDTAAGGDAGEGDDTVEGDGDDDSLAGG